MDFTGERFIPEAGLDTDIEIEHLQRYYSVCKLIEGKTVLDAASGSGYGTSILAEYASRVFGLEISEEAVSFSNKKYSKKNLTYTQGSIDQLPFANNSLDVVVSFETIEHVEEELQNSFIKEIKRTLKPNGILLMSSPDKHVYSDLRGYKNEFHIKEFYRDEFVDFLSPYFKHIRLYDQFAELSYLLLGEQRNLQHLTMGKNSFPGKYIIALCSNEELLSEMSIESMVVDRNRSHQDKLDRITMLQDEIDEKNEVIDDKNTLVYRAYSTVFQSDEKIDKLNEELEQLKKIHGQQLQELEGLKSKINEFHFGFTKLKDELHETSSTLNHIKQTKGYKLLQKAYGIQNMLLGKK